MELELLHELSIVAKHGNLSEASRELHTTVPVLSRHLKSIEAELGVTLFDRASNPMVLTPEGEAFLPLACEGGNLQERIIAFGSRYRRARIETVRVRGIIDAATLPLLRAAKVNVEAAAPHTVVKFLSHQYQTPFEDIRAGDLDIAVEPLSELIDTHDLEWFHLAYEQPFVILEANNPLAARDMFDLTSLYDLKFLSLRSNRENAMRKHVQQLAKDNGMLGDLPRGLVLSPCDSYDELFMAGLGEYALMLPENLARRYETSFAGQYVARPFVGKRVDYDLCAFYRAEAPAYVRAYLDELRKLV